MNECYDREVGSAQHWVDCKNKAEFSKWQNKARKKLKEILVLKRNEGKSEPRLIQKEICADHIRELWEMETEVDVRMPFYILKPLGTGPFPVAIAPHGHGFGAKYGVAGVWDNALIKEAAQEFNADYGRKLVQAGFVTAVPDARGFGDRREFQHRGEEKILECTCFELANLATGAGRTLAGMFVTDLIALADFMLTLSCADKKKGITCVGLSGGGMQTLLFSSVDKRVKQAIVSGYFYGAKKAMYDVPQCACNYPSRLWKTFDMRDLAALIAPRFLYIETGDRDPLNGGLENALREGEFAKKAYALAGDESRFCQEICSGGHRFYGKNSLPWLKSTVFNG